MVAPQMNSPPEWVLFHVPHDSTVIPAEVRDQFVLDDAALGAELLRMTDHHTFRLFGQCVAAAQVVRFPVSRLVVDVERFVSDQQEPMSGRGMGVVYTSGHDLRRIRRDLSPTERKSLLAKWYRPHHQQLTNVVDHALAKFGKALVVDCHSFPSRPLPYESDANAPRPQICIGSDEFHSPPEWIDTLAAAFQSAGFETAVNTPFAGALVPLKHYRREPRVKAVMIEVRRDLYVNEETGEALPELNGLAQQIRACLVNVCSSLNC